MKLSDYLSESGISTNLAGSNKSEVITNLVNILTETTQLKNREKLVEMLEERESLKTTGIGSGIAIPHCKSSNVDKVHIIIGISKEGIDFQSLDNKPANFFFLLVAPETSGSEHLKASAKIVRLFREASIREELLTFDTSSEVIEYIKAKE